jgi:hypothetical protein
MDQSMHRDRDLFKRRVFDIMFEDKVPRSSLYGYSFSTHGSSGHPTDY